MSGSTGVSTPLANVALAQTDNLQADPVPLEGAGGPPSPPPPPPPASTNFSFGDAVDVARKIRHVSYQRKPNDALYRPLRIYTVDPARGRLHGATATVNVPYEPLDPGPKGARFEVVGSRGLTRIQTGEDDEILLPNYAPVDLDDRRILIRGGHDPAPCDPIFHHQMAYAVACNTYAAFRHALGREIDWAFPEPRLKLKVHALEEAQARYTSALGEIEFGYFTAGNSARGRVPPLGTVYLCLSHDVVAHEVTHALVDGLRARYGRQYLSHVDVEAFHEAFADLVALLLRFSYSDVIRDAVIATGGRFWLHESFTHFGVQVGQGGGQEALRTIDLFEAARCYDPEDDCYALGTVLVSAVLEALVVVYQRKIDPYLRLAGESGDGSRLSTELVDIITHIASRLASHFLSICIRALDYCPPVGLDFGEYLRALVTADRALVPDDPWAYREALIDSFVKRRIYPRRVQSMSEDALGWNRPRVAQPIRSTKLSFAALRFAGDPASPFSGREVARRARVLGELVTNPALLDEFGLMATDASLLGSDRVDLPVVESVRSARRIGPDGQILFDLVCEVTQCRLVCQPDGSDVPYWGGSTIIIDPDGIVRYIIRKSLNDRQQIARMCLYREQTNKLGEVEIDPST